MILEYHIFQLTKVVAAVGIAIAHTNIISCHESRNWLCGISFTKKSINPLQWIMACGTDAKAAFDSNICNAVWTCGILCHRTIRKIGELNLLQLISSSFRWTDRLYKIQSLNYLDINVTLSGVSSLVISFRIFSQKDMMTRENTESGNQPV